MERMGRRPEETVMVGDQIFTDTLGANNAEMCIRDRSRSSSVSIVDSASLNAPTGWIRPGFWRKTMRTIKRSWRDRLTDWPEPRGGVTQ